MAKKIVIIGSGASGMTAASTARHVSDGAEIFVITEEEHVAYSPCAIPFVLDGSIKDFGSIIMHEPEFYAHERGISIRIKTKVTAVDIDKKILTLSSGETVPFDSLILATGGTVFIPPIEGVDLRGVFKVRYIKDGMNIQQAMKSAKSVVVAGAGVIGLEMAVAFRHAGLDVTVVEMFNQVVPRICDVDMAKEIQNSLESMGIKFVMGAPIGAIKGNGKVEAVIAAGKEYPCDMVIMATGIRANLELPNNIGLELGALGAVRVSATLQPYRKGRLVRDVYVAGDLVTCESAAVPGPTMSQLGSSAVRQGKVAGINAAGGYSTYPAVLGPWVSKVGELQVAGTGMSKCLAEYYGVWTIEGKAEAPPGQDIILEEKN